MRIRSDDLEHMQPIPEEYAFGRPGPDGEPVTQSANRNPHLAWSEVPSGTRSFVLLVVDTDVPTRGDDVNKEGRHVPASLPRTEFFHWIMVDIPAEYRELGPGSCADGVVAHGRKDPPGPPGSKQGINDYTGWFASDPAMAGDYFGYDGPCPPWNDMRPHAYLFCLYALDVPRFALEGRFTGAEAKLAIRGHILDEAHLFGVYSLNPDVAGALGK
jgi:Raf kinase inhibitor-like YbhB/YbcL family protein